MYKVQINKSVVKKLEKVPKKDYVRLREKLIELGMNPRPRWIEKLKSRQGYRVAVGNFRIIYEIDDSQLIVIIIDIGDRKDVYKT